MTSKAPKLSLDIINDALEYHSHVIVNGLEDGDADEHWESLRYFWKITQDQQIFLGRAFHRCRLAELVYFGCHLPPYGDLGDTTSRNKFDMQQAMVYWTPSDWESLERKLTRLCKSCKREDASEWIRSWDEERPQDHPRAQDNHLFGKRIKNLVDYIVINKHLSLIRLDLEAGDQVDVEDLREFWEELEQIETQDKKKHTFLKQFLTDDSTRRKPRLAPKADLREILKEKPCNLEALQADLLAVAMSWNKALFDNEEPALARLGYGSGIVGESMNRVDESEEEEDDNYDNGHNHLHDTDSHQERGERQDHSNSDEDNEDVVDNRKPAARTTTREIEHMRQARDSLRQAAVDPLQEAYETAGYVQPHEIKQEPESTNHGDQFETTIGESPRRMKETTTERYRREDATASRGRNYDGIDSEDGDQHSFHQIKRRRRRRRQTNHPPERTKVRSNHGDESDTTQGSSSKEEKSHQKKRNREGFSGDENESEHTEQSSTKPRHHRYGSLTTGRHDFEEEDAASERSSRKRRRRREKRSRKRSGSGSRIRFDSDDDDDDVQSVRISELPRFREATPAQKKKRGRNSDNNGQPGQPTRRKFFSAEEKDAIREGVRRFGHGKWIEILDEYPDVLKNRTNVQIKDCARTMMKNGDFE